ncbi:MAG: L-rhamnose mutarotase [Rhizobiales bacterium]|nr:L-rhamnose mutarotase [Hyphomicrobiales bacterium]NRB15607.1 L-rhamnose mutarotase [Hyphomicrobiales bacterium]
MSLEVVAFKMQLNPGQSAEYKRRHDDIWPELSQALRDAGVIDYSIHLDDETNTLFAVMKRKTNHGLDELSNTDLMQRWWAHMADIMQTNPDNVPISTPLTNLFEL